MREFLWFVTSGLLELCWLRGHEWGPVYQGRQFCKRNSGHVHASAPTSEAK